VPLYEYECTACGQRFERIEKVAGPHAKKCPKCGRRVERLMAAPAIRFKGSGWYVTDYGRKAAPSEAKGGDSQPGEAAKTEKLAKESKDSKETPAKAKKES